MMCMSCLIEKRLKPSASVLLVSCHYAQTILQQVPMPSLLLLQVWNIHSKKGERDLPGHADEVFSVDWSPDGASIASGGKDQVLKLWRH